MTPHVGSRLEPRHETPGHRRRGLHRLGRGPPHHPRHRLDGRQRRQADLRRQPRIAGRGARQQPPHAISRSISATARRSTTIFAEASGPTPCCTSRPRAMSTARSTAPRPSSRPMSAAPTRCSRPRSPTGARSTPSARARFRFQHISTDEVFGSLGADRQVHRDHALRSPTRPTPPARPRPTIWCAPGTTPTACRRSPPTAPTTTAPITSPRS